MRQKKSVNGKGNVIMNQNRRGGVGLEGGDNIKKSDTLSNKK